MNYRENFECRNCGGLLNPDNIAHGVIKCPFCGMSFAVIRENALEEVESLIEMGDNELSACSFDRAYSYYSKAADKDPDEPQAHMGKALAKFKVQFLKDIVQNSLQPICHEVGDKKFADSPDYKAALEAASPEQREIYVSQAEEIDYIRNQFLNLKASGLAYDTFICVKVTKSDDSNNDYMVLRVPVEEGFLRFGIKYPLSSICYTDACSMDASMASFYGSENMTTTVLNKITMTAIVYALQQYHGLSRKAAFDFVGVQIYDVYPVMKEGFYTFDDAHERPWMVNGDHIWERNRYRLYGESLFDGTASTADIKRFTKLYGSTMEYLRDVQAMFAIDKPLEDNFWWGGESYAPNWRTTTKTCALLCHFLYNQDDVDWDHDPLHGEKGLSDCDWGLRWINWSPSRNNRTDFVLLQRLGVIPFLPRITPDYKNAKDWEWLATARRRLYPACVVVWDKLEKQTAEIAKLSEMIGEPIDPKWLKKALEYDVLRSGRPDTAVFLLGAMEITALKREDAEKQLMEELESSCYVSLD